MSRLAIMLCCIAMMASCSNGSVAEPTLEESSDVPATTVSNDKDSPLVVSVDSPVRGAFRFLEARQAFTDPDPDVAVAALDSVAHPEFRTVLLNSMMASRDEVAESMPAGLRLRISPLSAMVDEPVLENAATVQVWAVQVVTGAGTVRSLFSTFEINLALAEGSDWMVTSVTVSNGPVPEAVQEATTPDVFETALIDFVDAQTIV